MYLNLDNNNNSDFFEPKNIFNFEKFDLLSDNYNYSFDLLDITEQHHIENKHNFFFLQTNHNLDYENNINLNKPKQIKYFEIKKQLKFNILRFKRKPLINFDSLKETKNNSLLENVSKEEIKKEYKKVKHDKYSNDNILKKCKHIVLSNIMKFINKKISSIYKCKMQNNNFNKKLLTINKSQISNTNILYNRNFLYKKISDILSDNISKKYSHYPQEHNKILIEELKNDEDKFNKKYFNKLFNLTFNECLGHFIGKKEIEELNGMNCFEDVKETLEGDKEYIDLIKYYLENFENIIYKINPRKPKKGKKLNSTEEESQRSF